MEERALICKCGWPCCANKISKQACERFSDDSRPSLYVSGRTATVYDMRAAYQFCSLECNKQARLFMIGLDTSALGLRRCYTRLLRPNSKALEQMTLPEALAYSEVKEHEVAFDSDSSDDEDAQEEQLARKAKLRFQPTGGWQGARSATAIEGFDSSMLRMMGVGLTPEQALFGFDDDGDDDDEDDDFDDEEESDDDDDEDEEEEEEDEHLTELDPKMKGLKLTDCGWVLNSLRQWISDDTKRLCHSWNTSTSSGSKVNATAAFSQEGQEDEEHRFITGQRRDALVAMISTKVLQMTASYGHDVHPVLVGVRNLIATFRMDDALRGFQPAQQAILAHVLCVVVTGSSRDFGPDQKDYVAGIRESCERFLAEHNIDEADYLPEMVALFE